MNHILLKEILKENPDGGFEQVGQEELKRVRKLGYDVRYFSNPYGRNVVAFTIDSKINQLVYALSDEEKDSKAYHWNLHDVIEEYQTCKNMPEDYIAEPNEHGDWGIAFDRDNHKKDIIWFMGVTDPKKLDTMARKWNTKAGYRSSYGPMLSGRLWVKRMFIAFWPTRTVALPHMDKIFELIKRFKIEPEQCLYEFVDKRKLYTFYELELPDTLKPRSDAEIIDLMKKQHLDPAAKRKLASIQGVQQQKQSPGFDFQAQRNAMRPAVAESMLLKDIVREGWEMPSDFEWKHVIPLAEDPDGFGKIPSEDQKSLRKKKFNVSKMEWLDFDSKDAVAFMLDKAKKEIVYSANINNPDSRHEGALIHPEIGAQIVHFWANPNDFEFFNGQGKYGAYFKPVVVNGKEWGPGDDEGPVYSLNMKDVKDFKRYLRSMKLPMDGYVTRNNKKYIIGRMWKDTRAISFWVGKKEVLPYMDVFTKLLDVFNLRPIDVAYQFIDFDHVFTYDELNKKYLGKPRPDAEIISLMKKQHLDPEAKKKLAAMLGGFQQKAHPGFEELPARRDAMMPALQEIARKIMRESPDAFHDVGMDDDWHAYDSRAFMTFPTFSLLASRGGKTHLSFVEALKECDEEQSAEPLAKYRIDCSNEDAFAKSMSEGVLGDYLDNVVDPKSGFEDMDDNEAEMVFAETFRDAPHTLCGRLWIDSQVISFWNEEPKILALWPQIQEMFRTYEGTLGDINEYRVDWLERSTDRTLEMTPVPSIGSEIKKIDLTKVPKEDEEGQLNFIASLFRNPDKAKSLTSDALKAVREKLHVLDPEAKGQLMKLAHGFYNKAAEIANALGMSVAEFNYLTQVAESDTHQ